MFGTLRARLIAAFVCVIFLSLLLASSAFAVLLAEYQTQREISRLQDLVLPISYQVRVLQFQGATPGDVAAFLERQAGEMGVRIAVIDPEGIVVHDTAGEALGARLVLPDGSRPLPPPGRGQLVARGSYQGPYGEVLFFAAPVRLPPTPMGERVERLLGRQDPSYVALLAPSGSIRAAWLELWPRLAGAALVSLLVSVAVALVLSASISRPLARITRASEEMARGNYEQVIPARGRDEITRLASAFNYMAREVARSQRAMRDLLANVSHDLRTPLTSVQGFSQAMVDGTLKDAQSYAEAGQIIHQEAARMQRLVEDLLYLSKIESGQLVLERRTVALEEVVQACVARMRRRAEQAGIDLQVEVAARPSVEGDGGRLEQVLDNLLGNALRHTPPRGQIAVRLGETSARGGRALLTVHNTGSYIPPEELARVFERFYQVDKARSGPSEGSGLGLAIAREIVQAHQGDLSASSTPDDGTSFHIALPLAGKSVKEEARVLTFS
ncbi:MAG: HAMP domain-containing histidine kinase [Chloroflexi bacterium]|nr:HAMP domain-containing histidine kinase [Chloroflexota bacterium]